MKTMDALPLKGKKVLLRVDFNVPMNKKGEIADDSRIQAALPTIRYLLDQNAAIVLISHMGRPKQGKDPSLSLKPCAAQLSKLLGKPVDFAEDCIGPDAENKAGRLQPGSILLLENLRFHDGEEKPEKDPFFAKALAKLADFYVDDAFGCAHRAHASIVPLAKEFNGRAAAGLLLEKEQRALAKITQNPEHPFMALIGGAKISSKLGVLHALLDKVDILAVGGAMAFTFLKAKGFKVGASLVEEEQFEEARKILEEGKKRGVSILLPLDVLYAESGEALQELGTVEVEAGIPEGKVGVDIGPKTRELFTSAMADAKTLFWNGPMGIFEVPAFAKGTEAIAKAFSQNGGLTVAGGGETVAAIMATPYKDKVSHLSTGGGASLEFIEKGTLPGIEVLI